MKLSHSHTYSLRAVQVLNTSYACKCVHIVISFRVLLYIVKSSVRTVYTNIVDEKQVVTQ